MIVNESRDALVNFIRERMQLLNNAVEIYPGQIDRQLIRDLAVNTGKIEDLAVTTAKIAALAVGSAQIDDLAVTTAKIADLAVETAKIAALAVTTAKIADLAVETAKINDLAVTTAKINDLAVTTAKIDELAVTEAKIDDLAVTNAKISELSADKITAGVLAAATIYLTGILMALADPDADPATQQRVVLDQNGIALFDASGNQLVNIPVSGDPYFHAQLEALGLTVLGDFSLRGTTNAIEPGATVTLKEAITAPATAPTLSSFWDALSVDISSLINLATNASAHEVVRRGLNYTASGGQGGATPSFYSTVVIQNSDGSYSTFAIEVNASTGILTRSVDLGANFDSSAHPGGAVRIGSNLWVLAFNATTSNWQFIRYNATASSTTFTSPTAFNWSESERGQGYPAMGSDGTDIYIADRVDGATPGAYQIHRYNTTPTRLSVVTTDYTPETFLHGATGIYVGNGDFGAARRVISETDSVSQVLDVRSFNSSGVQQANERFPVPAAAYGVAYDGTRFWTLRKGGSSWIGLITKHSTWKWTTESPKYWARFSYYQDDTTGMDDPGVWVASTNYSLGNRRRPTGVWTPGTTHIFEVVADAGSSGASEPTWPTTPGATVTDGGLTWALRDQESTRSPVASITHKKRSKLKITAVDIPAQASHLGFYLDRGTTEPTDLDLQQFATTKTLDVESFATSVVRPSPSSTFPAGTPATFETNDGSPLLSAKGLSRTTLEFTANSNVSNATPEYVRFGTEIADTDNYHASSTDGLTATPDSTHEITLPFTGQYLIIGRAQWATNGTGYRHMIIETNKSGSFVQEEAFTVPAASGVNTRVSWPMVASGITAGDKLRFAVQQNSGGVLALVSAKLNIIYLGPS